MKKLLFVLLFLYNISVLYAQELTIEFNKKEALSNDSLQKQTIKNLKDNIASMQEKSKVFEIEKSYLNEKIKSLEREVSSFNQKKIKVERDILQAKYDTLLLVNKDLKKMIDLKDQQILHEQEKSSQNSFQQNAKGKEEILKLIFQTYDKPFDELVKENSLKTVLRTKAIVGDTSPIQNKLAHLEIYFRSKQLLNEKYSKSKIDSALKQLQTLQQTDLLKNLTSLLADFKVREDDLKATLDEILKIDAKFEANDDATHDLKFKKVLTAFIGYWVNYEINFEENPFLSEIILDIINLKFKDANSDILRFKELLK